MLRKTALYGNIHCMLCGGDEIYHFVEPCYCVWDPGLELCTGHPMVVLYSGHGSGCQMKQSKCGKLTLSIIIVKCGENERTNEITCVNN